MKKIIGSQSRVLAGIAFLFALTIITNSCSKTMDTTYGSGNTGNKGGTGGPGANEVWIQGMAFNPSTITVAAGTTITWTNKDATGHTVTSKDGKFVGSGTLGTGGVFTYTFSTAGTYDYYCMIHPLYMTGTVIVN